MGHTIEHATHSYNQFERATISLRSIVGLMSVSGKKAKHDTAVLERYLAECEQGNYEHVQEFGRIAQDLLRSVEDIKQYARKQEHQDIVKLEQLLHASLHLHFIAAQPKALRRATRELLEEIHEEFKEEVQRERLLYKRKAPRGTAWNRFWHTDKSRARARVRNAQYAKILTAKESDTYDKAYALIHHISKHAQEDTTEEKHLLIKYLSNLMVLLQEEFSYIHQVQVHAAVQEYTLIKHITELKQQVSNQQLRSILEDLDAKFGHLIDADLQEARVMQAKELPRVASVKKMVSQLIDPKTPVPINTLTGASTETTTPTETQTSLDSVLSEHVFSKN